MNQEILSVSELTRFVKRLIDGEPYLQNIWVRAEISNFKKHSRGHMYFTLKDEKSRLNSVMFAGNNRFLKFTPENGMSILVRGDISVYEPHGQYQFYVKEMQPDGIGNLYLAFEELKKKLEFAGFFSQERKKPIPNVPESIAVITSPTGAAVRDIITTLNRRYPIAKVTLLPVLVQGPEAAPSVANAIQQANEANMFDVIIVGRGGGSLEELWAFNEQVVAEAIFYSNVPVISAVGHETDITISDFVADLRAPTPTAAAEMAVPDLLELVKTVNNNKDRLIRTMETHVSRKKDKLNYLLKSYAFRYPKQLIEQKEQDLDRHVESLRKEALRTISNSHEKLNNFVSRLERSHPYHMLRDAKAEHARSEERLVKNLQQILNEKQSAFSVQVSKLQVLSPLRMMERGFSLVYKEDEQLVKSINDVDEQTDLRIRLQDGYLNCQVSEKKEVELPKVKWGEYNDK
ncbi:exodeoxyribonuclease VII large subunit [Bacillus shivajii]|uniref:exodeoxyribonuclease VII large subunit n=1 Tax=Bacillus shivajii TaxID=1983719 RepID=UPI001CFB4760|nr:exodeoxyribonuclease VII large subunit [Bacillus shivajii]UCZ54611.1 exodeoxyribonuclease VII large subunit [Bacillus shivajii]